MNELQEQLLSLFTSLTPLQAAPALRTMEKIVRNILQNPDEDKYRRISTESVSFNDNVWQYPSGKQFLLLSGWELVDDHVVYSGDDLEPLILAEEALKKWRSALASSRLLPSPAHLYNPPPGLGEAAALPHNSDDVQKEHRERLRKLREFQHKQQEERRKIAEQIKADRAESKQREARPSHARQVGRSGANITRYEDIGVDLNKGG